LVEFILTLVAPIEMGIDFYSSRIAISNPIFRQK